MATKSKSGTKTATSAGPAPSSNSSQASKRYRSTGVKLQHCNANGDWRTIADLTAEIKRVVTDEGGERHLVITGRGWRSGKFTIEVAAGEFESTAKLKAALGSACPLDPIYPRMGEHLSSAIKTVSQSPERVARYQRTGWASGTFLLPGRDLDGVTVEVPGDLPYMATAAADVDEALGALDALIRSIGPAVTAPILAFLLGAPLAKPAGWRERRHGVMAIGRTGVLKTSFVQAAMAIYGSDFARRESYIRWGAGATQNALMALATSAADLPIFVDNYKPGLGGGSRAFVNLIHLMVEGGEKARLNRAAELRDTRPIFTWPIFTGEDMPDVDAAALARLLVIQFPWRDGAGINHDLEAAQQAADHLPAIGQRWIEWIEEGDFSHARQLFDEERQAWIDYLGARHPGAQNKLRLAQNLATNRAAWLIALNHPDLGAVLKSYDGDHLAGLRAAAAHVAAGTGDALEVLRLLNGLRQLLGTGQVYFATVADGSAAPAKTIHPWAGALGGIDRRQAQQIGWLDDDDVYLLPDVALEAYRRVFRDDLGDVSVGAISRQLDGLNALASTTGDRLQKKKQIAGERYLFWHIKLQTLQELGQGGGDDE